MAIESFDYKELAKNLAEQAKNLAPEDLCDSAKEYLVKTLENFTLLSGEALYNDSSIKLNAEQAQLITQIISEWTFHKCVDLARSGIDSKYWDEVMQKIAFTAFEVVKQATLKKLPQLQIVQAAEHHIVKAYNEAIDELYNDKKITEEIVEMAKSQSNIDKMAEEAVDVTEKKEYSQEESDYDDFEMVEIEEKKSSLIDWLKDNVGVVGLLIILITFGVILYFFKPSKELLSISTAILYFVPIITRLTKKYKHAHITMFIVPCIVLINSILMLIFHYSHAGFYFLCSLILLFYGFSILVKKDVEEQLQELEDVKNKMEYLISPDCMYEERFKIDILNITVGTGLLSIVDPDQEGELVPRLAVLRQELADDYGYVIPNVRIMDTSAIEEYEYRISIRSNVVATGFVYPNKYMVIADDWDKNCGELPEDVIIGVEPVYKYQAYWVSKDVATENQDKATFVDSVDVIKTHLRECVIKHVDEILTDIDVEKYIALVESQNPSQVKYLLEYLTVYDIRRIFVNLIREKVSIKDITFIFMKLSEFVKYSTDVLTLSEKLRTALARQICLAHANADRVLYAIELSSSNEELLTNSCIDTDMDRKIELESNQIQEILQATAIVLMKAKQEFDVQPVLIVNPKIRPAVYNLLLRDIPNIVVLSNAELIPDVKIVECGIIE